MNISNLLKEMQKVTPPFQAAILTEKDCLKSTGTWNPTTPKGKALFCQFAPSTKEDCDFSIMPDGCYHFLFKCDPENPEAVVLGVGTTTGGLTLEENKTYFYVTPYSMLGTNAGVSPSEMLENTVSLGDLFNDSEKIVRDISLADSFEKRIALFNDYSMQNIIDRDYTPGVTDFLAILMCVHGGTLDFDAAEEMLGYSRRHCRNLFKQAYGISPKKYSEIIRFQNACKALDGYEGELACLANNVGYYDQAHFTRDFKAFSGFTPEMLRKRLKTIERE